MRALNKIFFVLILFFIVIINFYFVIIGNEIIFYTTDVIHADESLADLSDVGLIISSINFYLIRCGVILFIVGFLFYKLMSHYASNNKAGMRIMFGVVFIALVLLIIYTMPLFDSIVYLFSIPGVNNQDFLFNSGASKYKFCLIILFILNVLHVINLSKMGLNKLR